MWGWPPSCHISTWFRQRVLALWSLFLRALILSWGLHPHIFISTLLLPKNPTYRYHWFGVRCSTYEFWKWKWKSLSHVWHFVTAWNSHGTLQARTLEWVAIPFSRGSSQLRDQTQVSRIAGRFFTSWATRETPDTSGSGLWIRQWHCTTKSSL